MEKIALRNLVLEKEGMVARISNFPVSHAFSTLKAGNMSLRWGLQEEVKRNAEKFYQFSGFSLEKRAHILPQFGKKIVEVKKNIVGKIIKCDGLFTFLPKITLSLYPGDCYPIILTGSSLIMLLHGSLKSVKKGILSQGVKIFIKYGFSPQEIKAGIGPGIRECCYHTNLEERIVTQLVKSGIPKENIFLANVCTCCTQEGKEYLFFSHTRSKITGEKEGRFAALAKLEGSFS